MAVERRQPRPLVVNLVRDTVREDQLERIRGGVRERRRAATHRRGLGAPRALAAAAAILILAAAALAIWWPGGEGGDEVARDSGPVLVVGAGALVRIAAESTATVPRRFDLSDGSSVELAPGTEVEASENTGRRVVLRLEPGRATFEVAPGGPRRWTVDAGLATVTVVGTVFTVAREDGRVEVSVARGAVKVRSDRLEGGARTLSAGDSVVIEARTEVGARLETPAQPEPGPSVDGGQGSDGGAVEEPRRSWQRYAREGDYGRAYVVLGGEGLRRETRRADSLDRLMTLADVARLSGHPLEAVAPLEQAIERFPGDTRAAVAAFTLGRLEADSLGRHGRAARAFRRCLELRAPRALREDAQGRLAETYARSGDFEAARATARDYLGRYPNGRHAEELRRWVEPR